VNRRERAVVLLLTAAFLVGTGVWYCKRARLRRQASASSLVVVQDTGAERARGPHAVLPPLDINQATARQLDGLPGIGPVLAQRIVDYRQRKGGFRSVGELRAVTGIGQKRYHELLGLVTVDSSGDADSGR
jgi:competence ComEA-like helix-hairpin-helix protein